MKSGDTLAEILQSVSEAWYPEESGEKNISINSRSPEDDTPLHVMTWRDDDYGTQLLIAAGADVNAIGDMGETPLHVAISKECTAIVRLLLDAGANPDICCEFGDTARERATQKGGIMATIVMAKPNPSFKFNAQKHTTP